MCKKRMRAFLHICLSFAKVVNIIYKCKENDNILLNNVYFCLKYGYMLSVFVTMLAHKYCSVVL